ncbi:UDP-N-acetylmuramoyl-L-alanine--D-glutamate ligase [Patescibacteria group bacterium]|nr:UDP-N-acetylmuramoyl-L-alanine--D-glutamate ligase [Patescibacteria group bacterium]
MKKVAILGGLGIEGVALQKYLKKTEPDLKPIVLDKKTDPKYLSKLEDFDLIYRAPGVLCSMPEIKKAVRRGVKFSSTINLFFEKAKGQIIGVTGSKGKGTTTQMIYEVLKKADKDVHVGGNIGNSPLEFVDKLTNDSITVLELSNLQLWDIKYSPHIAVVLDVFPEHLDWHKNLNEYVDAKMGITKYQRSKDIVFYASGNKLSQKIAKKGKGRKVEVKFDKLPIKLSIPGRHNLKNASMTASICSHLGVNPQVSLDTIAKFKGLPHRLQKVREVKGAIYYNDSASTAPETTVAGIKAFPKQSKILILGGKDKNSEYKTLEKGMVGEDIKLAILIGESKEKIKLAIKDVVKTRVLKTLEEAVGVAYKIAKPDDIVLFSPGATSLDMFKSYKDRGEQFERIVKKLKD